MIFRILALAAALLPGTMARASHDESLGARFVEQRGADSGDCLDHDAPCASVRYALARAEPGNTVKVGAGVHDFTGLDPESFLYGPVRATGGYGDEDHYRHSRPDEVRSVAIGVSERYRNALAVRGFHWASSDVAARRGEVAFGGGASLQVASSVASNCVQGSAGQFPCRNVDFLAQIPLSQFSSRPASAANVWGLVDLNDNREYAIVGLRNGTAVVDVTDPVNPREVATIPGNASAWREVKAYQYRDTVANRWRAYAYVATEAANSGIQTIDLSGLPNSIALASTITDTSSQHTLYVSNIDYDTNVARPGATAWLYAAGANTLNGAWRGYRLANPAQPVLAGVPASGTQYMHDSSSVLIADARTSQCAPGHNPCEVLIDFNENSVDLWDVTDKLAPLQLSSTTYNSATYTHSGWPSTDQQSVFVHDELEEIRRGLNTQIYTLNLSNLRSPTIVTSYTGTTTTTDHNGYTRGNYYYVSHYRRGLVVFDVSNPNQLVEVAHFDHYLSPAANSAGTDGAWGVYPFLPSGNILMSDIENGLFILRDHSQGLATNAGRLGFGIGAATASESSGSLAIAVRRVAGSAGAVSVQYATADGTALAGSDYTAATGTLSWAAGELADRVINIAVASDGGAEGSESLQVTLSNFSGGASVDGAATLAVTISDSAPAGGGGGAFAPGTLVLLMWLLRRRVRDSR